MPSRKAENKRKQELNFHYQTLKLIKEHNLSDHPISFKELCQLSDPHLVSRFIVEAESWGMIESK
jgi:transcriptional regulator of NAD metabolism